MKSRIKYAGDNNISNPGSTDRSLSSTKENAEKKSLLDIIDSLPNSKKNLTGNLKKLYCEAIAAKCGF